MWLRSKGRQQREGGWTGSKDRKGGILNGRRTERAEGRVNEEENGAGEQRLMKRGKRRIEKQII